MLKNRIISSVIVDTDKVVQTEGFEFKHYIHSDAMFAIESFLSWSVDELVIINVSREDNNFEKFIQIIRDTSEKARLPITVGGWINSVSRGEEIIRLGAEKLIINTSFSDNPEIPRILSKRFGKQCIVASIDYKIKSGVSRVFFDRGRRESNYSLEEWAQNCIENGAGELYVTNIDFDGKRGGYDLDAISKLKETIRVPIVLFGGAMNWDHFAEGLDVGASGVAAANIFHYKELASLKLRKYLLERNYNVRELK